jgi:hypothetical protein
MSGAMVLGLACRRRSFAWFAELAPKGECGDDTFGETARADEALHPRMPQRGAAPAATHPTMAGGAGASLAAPGALEPCSDYDGD